MLEISIFALFVTGLLGGGHCLGMCGGLVTALSVGRGEGMRPWPALLAYNSGRIGSYVLIGALAGGLSGFLLSSDALAQVRLTLYVLSNAIIILLGLYLAGLSGWIARIEKLGQPLWRRLQPLARRCLPVRSLSQAALIGALWGWLPCGLVYSASLSALASASPMSGALLMLAFGLGTLPNLLLMGALAGQVKHWLQQRRVRLIAGLAVCATGLFPLARLLATAWP